MRQISKELEKKIVYYARQFYSIPGISLRGISDKVLVLPSDYDRNKYEGWYHYHRWMGKAHLKQSVYLYEIRENGEILGWGGLDINRILFLPNKKSEIK